MEWSICFPLDSEQDGALIVMNEAQKHFSFASSERTTRRLAIHEAVLNALKYGGGAVLAAFGNGREMRVEICQKNKIVFPADLPPFRGTSLIRRYVRETEISADGRTLILRFY